MLVVAWSMQCCSAVSVARVYVKMAACYTGLSTKERAKLEKRVGESVPTDLSTRHRRFEHTNTVNSAQLNHKLIFTAATGCVCCSLTDAVLKKMVDQDEYAMSGFINELLVLVGLIKVRCAYVCM